MASMSSESYYYSDLSPDITYTEAPQVAEATILVKYGSCSEFSDDLTRTIQACVPSYFTVLNREDKEHNSTAG